MWRACFAATDSPLRSPPPAPRFCIGLFSAFPKATSHCRRPRSRPFSTSCSGSPLDRRPAASDALCYINDRQAGDQRMTASPERLEGTVDPKLLEILVCPLTKGPLEFDAARQELISRSAKLAYPIRDGIPIMLPEEARKIE